MKKWTRVVPIQNIPMSSVIGGMNTFTPMTVPTVRPRVHIAQYFSINIVFALSILLSISRLLTIPMKQVGFLAAMAPLANRSAAE